MKLTAVYCGYDRKKRGETGMGQGLGKGLTGGGAGGRTGFNRGRGRGYTEPGAWAGGRDLARDKGVRAEDLEQGGVICMLGYIPRDTNRDKTLYFSSVVYFRGASPAKCTKAWVCVFFPFSYLMFRRFTRRRIYLVDIFLFKMCASYWAFVRKKILGFSSHACECVYVHIHEFVCVCVYVNVFMCTYMFVCMCMRVRVNVCVQVCVYE